MKWFHGTAAAVALCLAANAGTAAFAEEAERATGDAPNSLVSYTESVLAQFAQTPAVVPFVAAANARRQSVAEMKALDEKWAASTAVESYIWDRMRNQLAWALVDFQYQHLFIVEAFAMDGRGAIIAETNRTSGYYKGEARKFIAAFANGAGAVWYGPAQYDDSTGEMEIQVSVPVMKGAAAIGVICFGVSLDRWEQRREEK